jgi:hypothetical protein
MNVILPSLLVSAVFCALAADTVPRRADEKTLQVACSFDAGERAVNVALRNVGKDEVYIYWSGPAVSYKVDLTTANGASVTLTELGRHTQLPPRKDGEFRPETGSVQTVTLQPGELRTETIRLAYLYTIPADGGAFKVRVGRKLENQFSWEGTPQTTTLWCKPMTLQLPPIKQ